MIGDPIPHRRPSGLELSVTDVCFEVGCQSLGTFSTRFTELVGVPPSVYKQKAAAASNPTITIARYCIASVSVNCSLDT